MLGVDLANASRCKSLGPRRRSKGEVEVMGGRVIEDETAGRDATGSPDRYPT
jgi:hypothetical protein